MRAATSPFFIINNSKYPVDTVHLSIRLDINLFPAKMRPSKPGLSRQPTPCVLVTSHCLLPLVICKGTEIHIGVENIYPRDKTIG